MVYSWHVNGSLLLPWFCNVVNLISVTGWSWSEFWLDSWVRFSSGSDVCFECNLSFYFKTRHCCIQSYCRHGTVTTDRWHLNVALILFVLLYFLFHIMGMMVCGPEGRDVFKDGYRVVSSEGMGNIQDTTSWDDVKLLLLLFTDCLVGLKYSFCG